jgi:cytosine/uracil/thiamine/allantoin permease
VFDAIYVYAWFVGFFLAGGIYWAGMVATDRARTR